MIRVVRIFCLLLTSSGAVWAQLAPVLSNLEGTNLIYSEGDPATSLTSTIQLTSEAPIARVLVRITDNYVAEQDRLVFTETDGIRSVYDEATGTLRLLSYPAGSSSSSVSFQNALRTVAYQNTNLINPQAGLRSIAFQAFDEQNQESVIVTRNLSVLARDNPPELALADDTPILYPIPGSGQEARVLDGLTVTDQDGDFIESAEVTIREGYRDLEDQLTLSGAPGGGIGVTGNGSRTVTLNGRASLEAYQDALRSVQFSNSTSPDLTPTEGNRTITATVNDGNEESTGLSRFVVVGNSTNAPPAIRTVTKATTLGTDLIFAQTDFSDQYSDREGNNSFTGIFIRSQPQRGTLLFKGAPVNNSSINRGQFVSTDEFSELVYQSTSNFTGGDRFLWNASDGGNFAANNAAVVITITAPELAIELDVPGEATTEEDTEVLLPPVVVTYNQEVPLTTTLAVSDGTLTLPTEVVSLLGFTSGDGTADPSMVFTGSASAVAYALSGLRYLPDENYNGPDALSVSVSATSSVNKQGTLAITVVPGNDPFQLSNLETDALVYVENDPPVALTSQLTVEDLDSESTLRIASATVTISEGYVAGEDILQVAPLLGITGSQQDNVLTLSGVSDIGNYQAALRTVLYQNTSDDPAPAKTVAFALRDEADSTSNTVIRPIIVQAVDDSLQVINLEDSPINYVVENDFSRISNQVMISDVDNRTIDRVVVSVAEGYNPSLDSLYLDGFGDIPSTWNDNQGVLTLTGDNTLETYTRALRAVRYRNNRAVRDEVPRAISIQAFNGELASEVVSRPIVLIANDPPVVSDFTLNVNGDTPYVLTLTTFVENYTDPDNAPTVDQPAEIRITALPTQGILIYRNDTLRQPQLETLPGGYVIPAPDIEAKLLSYVPNPGFTGPDEVRWNAFDGAEVAAADARIAISVRESLVISLVRDSVAVCPGVRDTLEVVLVSNQPGVTYAWTCEGDCGFVGVVDTPLVVITPAQPTRYTITVRDPLSGLQAQDTVTVTVDDCPSVAPGIPTAFTPDGDQTNNEWIINNTTGAPLTVEVFDRYGNSVYRSEDYRNDWEGTYEGEALPIGTYYYIVSAADGETYKGAISILR